MDLSKFSTDDLQALKAGDLSAMSTEGLLELKKLQTPPSIAEQNLADLNGKGPVDDLVGLGKAAWDATKTAGKYVAAGGAGIADLVAGNGLNKSVENINHVKNDEDPTSAAGVIGEAIGDQFTPVQIAAQAIGGRIAEVVGPALANTLSSWGAKAAANAVGKIKKLGDILGVTNMEELGNFLLKPIQLGDKSFPAIVTATNTPADMLKAAENALAASGKQLEAVAGQADQAVAQAGEDGGISYMMDLPKLKADVQALIDEYEHYAPELSSPVLGQYKKALADLSKNIDRAIAGNTGNLFSEFSKLKTILGSLIYKHGSPLESKAALNDVYQLLSRELSSAADKVGGTAGAAYAQANNVYHMLKVVVEGLEGKVADADKLFDPAAFLTAMSSGAAAFAHSPVAAAVAIPAGYVAARAAESQAPQAIAAGLKAVAEPTAKLGGHSLVSGGLQVTARGVPVAARGIIDALTMNQADEE